MATFWQQRAWKTPNDDTGYRFTNCIRCAERPRQFRIGKFMRRAFLSNFQRLIPWIVAILIFSPATAADYKVSPVVLDDENPDRHSVGSLLWRGGVVISSDDPRFGGLSALDVARDGTRLVALSDRGIWLTASLEYRGGDLANVKGFKISRLLNTDGVPLKGRRADAESLAVDDGAFIVSFERQHRLWRYGGHPDGSLSRPIAVKPPPGFQDLSDNGGIEAMTRLCDGRLVVVAEKSKGRGNFVTGWLQSGTNWQPFRYRTKGSLLPTGATTLPNCDLVFVERSFSIVAGLDIRLSRIRVNALQENAIVEPEELAHLTGSLTMDNFEGISARRGKNGETLFYLVADDNFSSIQRTLLFMFELGESP